MKKITTLGLAVAFVFVLAGAAFSINYHTITPEEVAKADRITVDELKEAMASGKRVVIYDFRSPGDYKKSGLRIKGDERMQPEDLKADNPKLPKNKDLLIVTYCT